MPCPGKAGHHRSNGYVQYARGFVVGQIFDTHQQQNRLLILGQLVDGGQEIADAKTCLLYRIDRGSVDLFESLGPALPALAPILVDVEIAKDREQPGAEVAVSTPQNPARHGSLQAILHEVVGSLMIARDRERIAAQRRYLRLYEARDLIQDA